MTIEVRPSALALSNDDTLLDDELGGEDEEEKDEKDEDDEEKEESGDTSASGDEGF